MPIALFAITACTAMLIWVAYRSCKKAPTSSRQIRGNTQLNGQADAVGKFYDNTTDAFLQVYGEVIQAFRTKDVSGLLHHQASAMGLKPGMRLLDAGCGVCGPAIFFAKNYGVEVDAVTASEKQAEIAAQKIEAEGMSHLVTVRKGDYHHLSSIFKKEHYDAVCFLESFGHSHDKAAAIHSAWEVLKPGGLLYIKDLFIKESMIPEHKKIIRENVNKINAAYRYNVGDLYDVMAHIRLKGFILSAIRTIDIKLEDFENLTISNQFQELTGIHRIDNLQSYLFPVDFFELTCLRPWYDPKKGNSRYFMQNLYYLQVLNKAEHEL
ncbi:MAG TPA: class I SAM-dependent methyltransferase [Chitinophagaceae bacterium]